VKHFIIIFALGILQVLNAGPNLNYFPSSLYDLLRELAHPTGSNLQQDPHQPVHQSRREQLYEEILKKVLSDYKHVAPDNWVRRAAIELAKQDSIDDPELVARDHSEMKLGVDFGAGNKSLLFFEAFEYEIRTDKPITIDHVRSEVEKAEALLEEARRNIESIKGGLKDAFIINEKDARTYLKYIRNISGSLNDWDSIKPGAHFDFSFAYCRRALGGKNPTPTEK
jgi:hypothetical protein